MTLEDFPVRHSQTILFKQTGGADMLQAEYGVHILDAVNDYPLVLDLSLSGCKRYFFIGSPAHLLFTTPV